MAKPGFTEWWFQLIDQRTNLPIDDDTGVYNVLTVNDPSELTIYSDDDATSKTNPGTITNGEMRFWTADTVTTLDLSLVTANSVALFVESLTPSDHRVVINPDAFVCQMVIPYVVVGASEAIVDTGFDISANMLVKDCYVHVTTLGTGANLDIGTSTDSDGFVDGITVDATGYPVALLEEVLTSATKIGALISIALTADYARKLHKRANATSGANIVYTNTTSSSTAGEGYIYVTYQRIPTT